MNNNLKCKEIFSSRFSELMKEHFPPINNHKEEKQTKQTAREDFELLQKLDADKANDVNGKTRVPIQNWSKPV